MWGDSDRPAPLREAGLAGGSWSIRGRAVLWQEDFLGEV